MKIKISLIFLISFFYANVSSGENLIMPEELVRFAEENGCNQVSDFYKRPGMVRPPYIYGYLSSTKEENSAVFWCEKEANGNKKYFLLFMFKNGVDNELTKCPNKIEWNNPPAGLSVFRDENETLENFMNIKNPNKKTPKNIRLKHNGILSEYDGVAEFLYCYQGEWYIKQRD